MARFTKTALGREEITARRLALDRPTRNLLLIIDASRDGDDWLRLVNGVEPAALVTLQQAGLIEAAVEAAASARQGRRAASAPRVPASMDALDGATSQQALADRVELDDAALYERLQGVIKTQFGLVQGYRLVLQIERDSEGAALRAAARRVIELVREQKGDEAAAAVAWTLGIDG